MMQCEKVILLGMDGLDPRILQLLIAEGAASNFARLWRQGCGGPLQTISPVQSPVVWTTLATGANPGKHGVFDFIQRHPERPLPFLSICQEKGRGLLTSQKYIKPRRNAAFWDVLSERGIPVSVVRWPVTFPAESINGRMFSGLGVPGIRGTLGHYTLYTDDPRTAPAVSAERLAEIQMNNDRADTLISGPRVRGITRLSTATVPMTIHRTDVGVTVEVAGHAMKLAVGDWSDWVRVEFSAGPFKTVSAIAKFYLVQREPAIKLYMSPLELDPERPAFTIASPPGYAEELASTMGPYHTLGMPEDTKAFNENAVGADVFVEQCKEITQERFRMFWHEFERFDDGVFAFVFDTSDRIQHMFWRGNTMDDAFGVLQLSPRIREHYLEMDRFLGELLGAVDSRTALIVVSDHGFTSFHTCFDLNAWLAAEGFMKLVCDPKEVGQDERSLYKLVDWSQTVAYGCGFSSLYFNLKGREGKGIVGPAATDGLARKIAERMKAYRDPKTGARPISRLSRREEIYKGPELGDAPDMVLDTCPGYRMSWETPVGGIADDILSPNEKHWSGDHIVNPASVPGTILSNLPLELSGAEVEDIAPTVLALLGLEPPADCDGHPLFPAQEA